MKIGYARVSTEEQNLDLQLQALAESGCDQVFRDQGVSGSVKERPGLWRAMRALHAGDVLVVWKLDRLGRSLPHLIETISALQTRNIGLQSIKEQIDTSSPVGRFYLHMLAALAEFEREIIRERTRAGMEAARRRGVRLGRPPRLLPAQVSEARARIANGQTMRKIADEFGVSQVTLRRALAG